MSGLNAVCMKCDFEEDCHMQAYTRAYPLGHFVCENSVMRPA